VTAPWQARLDEAARRIGRADARRILAEVTGRGDLAPILAAAPGPLAVSRFDELVDRRAGGEPLQYVLGSWSFRSLDLLVDRRVLIPRPETEELAGLAIDEVRARLGRDGPVRIVDLGTGSGALALAVAAEVEASALEVWATDVSADAVEVARANLAGLGTAGTRVRVAHGDWYDALPHELAGALDVVVSNPPYVAAGETLSPEVADWEPRSALLAGPDGTEAHAAVLAGAAQWLAPGGVAMVEIAPHQAVPVAAMAVARGLTRPRVVPDLTGRLRVVVARRP